MILSLLKNATCIRLEQFLRVLLKLIILVSFFIFFTFTTLAANDSFTVSLVLNGDTTPPTTPTLISTVPVTSSQVDITWSTSTDNVLMGGYQVFRDATQITTTTLLSYSDSGLSPATLYTYTIRAFDSSNNFSTTSASLSTTTLVATIPTSTSSASNGGVKVDLVSLDIVTDIHSAEFTWKTDRYAKFSLRWGRTVNYEMGFLSTDIYSRDHSTRINELEPDTVYEYELIGYDRRGEDYTLSRGNFLTLKASDSVDPPNISNLRADESGNDVSLKWVNPTVDDFSHVRVVRSHLFFPTDPYDGYIVYQGSKEAVIDGDAFMVSPGQYYTVFSYDQNGNVSSGAVVYIQKTNSDITKPFSEQGPVSTTSVEEINIDFNDFKIIQDNKNLNSINNNLISIDGSKPVTVSVPYDVLPEHLKTILVTFTHPDDSDLTFSFLLRVNNDKTAYEATIAPFYRSGEFVVSISIFDFKTSILKQVEGTLDSTYSSNKKSGPIQTFWLKPAQVIFITVSLIILLLFILLRFILKKKNEDQTDSNQVS